MKICFFGNISGALKGSTPGGGQLQIALLAKALALYGQEVTVVDPELQESFITEEGIKMVNVPGWNKGIRGFRLFFSRIPKLKQIFISQNADFYYVRMRTYMHLVPFWASRKTKGKFIIAIASDLDVSSFFKKFKYEYRPKFNLFRLLTVEIPNDFIFHYLLKKADFVILQHSGQKPLLKSGRGNVIIFPNIFASHKLMLTENYPQNYFVYVGVLSVLKGTESLYKLINRVSNNICIVIIGQPVDSQSKRIYEQLKQKQNVILKGRLNHHETMQLIANARALVSTSNFEGFPNIFLEAWSSGVPVISLNVNPGNVFDNYSLGVFCSGDINKMKDAIEHFEANLTIDSTKMNSYVNEVHNVTTAAERFLSGLNTSQKN